MRHRIAFRKLGRPTAHRLALLRNQCASLIRHGRIKTTVAKAKELQPLADKMVTLAKKQTVAAKRQMARWLYEHSMVEKAFHDFPIQFADRQGGYTRILKLAHRRKGDGAEMAIIEYLDRDKIPPNPKKKKKKKQEALENTETNEVLESTQEGLIQDKLD